MSRGLGLRADLPTVQNLRRAGGESIAHSGFSDTPALDADILLTHVTGLGRAQLHAFGDALVDTQRVVRYEELVARRAVGEPVAYLIGSREFYGLTFLVTRDTLIPRPETELLVECAMRAWDVLPPQRILDLGTGAGCLAVALAHVFPEAAIWATDVHAAARRVAASNAERLGCSDRVRVLEHRFGRPLPPDVDLPIDLVVSNPPYVSESEYQDAPIGVREFEPVKALLAGSEGLDHYPAVIQTAETALRPGGWLLVEIGATQADAVRALLPTSKWRAVEMREDLAGHPRIVMAQRVP